MMRTSMPMTTIGNCQIVDQICLLGITNNFLRQNSKADPLELTPMRVIQRGYYPVQIDLSLHQIDMIGLSNASVNHAAASSRMGKKFTQFEIDMKIPIIYMNAFYDIKGNFTIVPIEGRGNVTFMFDGLDVIAKFLVGQKTLWRNTYTVIDRVRLSRFNYKK